MSHACVVKKRVTLKQVRAAIKKLGLTVERKAKKSKLIKVELSSSDWDMVLDILGYVSGAPRRPFEKDEQAYISEVLIDRIDQQLPS